MATRAHVLDAKVSSSGRIGILLFGIALVIGFIYAGSHLITDLSGIHNTSAMPYLSLIHIFSCHPVLSSEARVALTLRLLGGLTTEEIARAFLASEPAIAQRIVLSLIHI